MGYRSDGPHAGLVELIPDPKATVSRESVYLTHDLSVIAIRQYGALVTGATLGEPGTNRAVSALYTPPMDQLTLARSAGGFFGLPFDLDKSGKNNRHGYARFANFEPEVYAPGEHRAVLRAVLPETVPVGLTRSFLLGPNGVIITTEFYNNRKRGNEGKTSALEHIELALTAPLSDVRIDGETITKRFGDAHAEARMSRGFSLAIPGYAGEIALQMGSNGLFSVAAMCEPQFESNAIKQVAYVSAPGDGRLCIDQVWGYDGEAIPHDTLEIPSRTSIRFITDIRALDPSTVMPAPAS